MIAAEKRSVVPARSCWFAGMPQASAFQRPLARIILRTCAWIEPDLQRDLPAVRERTHPGRTAHGLDEASGLVEPARGLRLQTAREDERLVASG